MTSLTDRPVHTVPVRPRYLGEPLNSKRARVVMVEDHILLAESLRMAWSTEGFEVFLVSPYGGAQEALLLPRILNANPDIVVLDLNLGSATNGALLVPPLRRAGIQVLVLTGSTDKLRWGAVLAAGASGVVAKAASLEEITGALHRLAAGEPVMSPTLRSQLVRQWYAHNQATARPLVGLDRLSSRERQVLKALASGKRVREIADSFFVSEATVRSHVKSILSKLGVNSQIAAVAVLHQAQRQPAGY